MYNNQELAPGIWRYVIEHIQNLDTVLADQEKAGITIAKVKSRFSCFGIKIIGYICASERQYPDTSQVLKIWDQLKCVNVTAARAFIGVYVYYQIWIKDFAQVAAPIYSLFKKNAIFEFEKEQTEVMDLLKLTLIIPLPLVFMNYIKGASDIILAIDASLDRQEEVLMQLVKGKKPLSRYESGIWSNAKINHNITKWKCQGVLKVLEKVWYWLYRMRLILETNANVVVAQLNRLGTDLPGTLVTRWQAQIQHFEFKF